MGQRVELHSLAALLAHLQAGKALAGCVLQSLDLRDQTAALLAKPLTDSLLLGCELDPSALAHAQASGALVFPALPGRPFRAYRSGLYDVAELLGEQGSYADSLDARVYRHYHDGGGEASGDLSTILAMRLHDQAITEALHDLIAGRKVVAIMGGHALGRERREYAQVARLAWRLAREGFLLTSGGGPGAMEATHVGAWFAGYEPVHLESALVVLAQAPSFKHPESWLAAAREVRRAFPLREGPHGPIVSLGVPTWLYGHEPPNAFATHIAKYFANSVREEGLLAIATHGVVFAPGGPGTVQEIFQEAAQNHYGSFGPPTPMLFLGQTYWTSERPVYPLLCHLAAGQEYARWLAASDDEQWLAERVLAFAGRTA